MSSGAIEESTPQVRLVVSCPRSGSTLLTRIFAENKTCAVSSGLILTGETEQGSSFKPNYSLFTDPQNHPVVAAVKAAKKRFLINKDELGHEVYRHQCHYDLFPDPACYLTVKPAFLFRDPVRIFDSWKALGWDDLNSLKMCMAKLDKMLKDNDCSIAILYERLVQQPEPEIQALCSWWDIPYEQDMLYFQKRFGDHFFRDESVDSAPQGMFATVKNHSEVVSTIQPHRKLTSEELEIIENSVGKLYLQLWGSRLGEIQAILHSKDWFAFDLDDTLHDFSKSSGTALLAVLAKISADHGTNMDEMQKLYDLILAEKTAAAFTDERTSREYRKERFEALASKLQLSCNDEYFNLLADIYEATLATSLRLKCGASSLLATLKSLGKKIAIITEGPEDAQIWTLQQLGIYDKVDFLATTNRFRTSKVDGLLRRVLAELKASANDLVYIGHSWPRDMEPAIREKVYAIHYSEVENVSLDQTPVRVNTLMKVQTMLGVEPVPTG